MLPKNYFGVPDDDPSMALDKPGSEKAKPDFDQPAAATHQANVEAVMRRGLYSRIQNKLDQWKVLQLAGMGQHPEDVAEIELLETLLADVVQDMEAAGQF